MSNSSVRFSPIGAVAAMESKRLSERTKAGMARARAEGKHCGRPRKVLSRTRLTNMRQLRQQGETISAIAKRMRLSRVMVWRHLAAKA
jgi:putative DNA-invertase from lambdoid prophage Rac